MTLRDAEKELYDDESAAGIRTDPCGEMIKAFCCELMHSNSEFRCWTMQGLRTNRVWASV